MTIQELFNSQKGNPVAIKSALEAEQEKYALITVPKLLSKTILGWAEEYIEPIGAQNHAELTQKRAEWMLNDLIERVQAGHMVLEMVLREGVAERYVEQCVERIQALTLGGQA